MQWNQVTRHRERLRQPTLPQPFHMTTRVHCVIVAFRDKAKYLATSNLARKSDYPVFVVTHLLHIESRIPRGKRSYNPSCATNHAATRDSKAWNHLLSKDWTDLVTRGWGHAVISQQSRNIVMRHYAVWGDQHLQINPNGKALPRWRWQLA